MLSDAVKNENAELIENFENSINVNGEILKQVVSEIQEQKLNQVGSEIPFPTIFPMCRGNITYLLYKKAKQLKKLYFMLKEQ